MGRRERQWGTPVARTCVRFSAVNELRLVGGRGEGTRGLRKRPFKGTRAATHLSQSQRHCQQGRGDLNGATPDPFALHALLPIALFIVLPLFYRLAHWRRFYDFIKCCIIDGWGVKETISNLKRIFFFKNLKSIVSSIRKCIFPYYRIFKIKYFSQLMKDIERIELIHIFEFCQENKSSI